MQQLQLKQTHEEIQQHNHLTIRWEQLRLQTQYDNKQYELLCRRYINDMTTLQWQGEMERMKHLALIRYVAYIVL